MSDTSLVIAKNPAIPLVSGQIAGFLLRFNKSSWLLTFSMHFSFEADGSLSSHFVSYYAIYPDHPPDVTIGIDNGTLLLKFLCNGLSNALRASRHNHYFIFKLHFAPLLLISILSVCHTENMIYIFRT